MPRKDFGRSRQNTYGLMDTNDTEISMALHDLELTSDLIAYDSHHSKTEDRKG